MEENVVECQFQLGIGADGRLASVGGDGEAVEQHLLIVGMIGRPHGHRPVIRAVDDDHACGGQCRNRHCRRIDIPASEHVRERLDRRLIVGDDRQPIGIQLDRAIRVQRIEADREELQHLAGIVFIARGKGRGNRLLVAPHVQILPHDRVQRDIFEQLAEIAEGVIGEHVVVGRQPRRLGIDRVFDPGHHENLAVGKRHPLPQLVVAGEGIPPPALGNSCTRQLVVGRSALRAALIDLVVH